MAKTRVKKVVVSGVTRDQMEEAFGAFAFADAKLQGINAAMDAEITKIRERNAEEIANFCSLKYDVTFPLMAKIDVNGDSADPLYDWLKAEAPGLMGTKSVKWNFTKFLIDREGRPVRRYAPTVEPAAIEADIRKLL